MVSQYAHAGYLNGYGDTEYLEMLPKIPVFVDHEPKGYYISFEVRGDSMNDGSINSLAEGDILVCRKICQDLWQYKLHINKWYFVIVHKTEGIIVKKITHHNVETGEITLHSLNDLYPDMTVSLNDVAQLFNVVQIQRKGLVY